MKLSKRAEKLRDELVKKYIEYCDNESGSFLSHQLEAIRGKAFRAGYSAARLEAKVLEEELEKLLSAIVNTRRSGKANLAMSHLHKAMDKAGDALKKYREEEE